MSEDTSDEPGYAEELLSAMRSFILAAFITGAGVIVVAALGFVAGFLLLSTLTGIP